MPPKKAKKDTIEVMRKALKDEVDTLMEKGKIDPYTAGTIREKIYDDKFEEVKAMLQHILKPKPIPQKDSGAEAREAKLKAGRERLAQKRAERLAKAEARKPSKKEKYIKDIEDLIADVSSLKHVKGTKTKEVDDLIEGIEAKLKTRKTSGSTASKIKQHALTIAKLAEEL